jgi:hypothetical protein
MKRIFSSICAASLLSMAPILFAQNPSLPAAASPNFGGGGASRPEPIRMDIDFTGGDPKKLIFAMEEASHTRPNVIIHPEAANIKIPAFSLRNVTAGQVFTALNMLNQTGDGGLWQPVINEAGEIWTLMPPPRQLIPPIIDPSTGLPVGQNQPAKPARSQSRQCRVFNLTPVLDDYTVEDVTTAVKGAWELMNVQEEPVIKYHKDTKLLIAFGEPNELALINQVISELSNNVRIKQALAAKTSEAPKTEPQQPKKL